MKTYIFYSASIICTFYLSIVSKKIRDLMANFPIELALQRWLKLYRLP